MVNPSFNTIYKSNERIERMLSAVMANMKRIEEKVDRLTSLAERDADSHSFVNSATGILRIKSI